MLWFYAAGLGMGGGPVAAPTASPRPFTVQGRRDAAATVQGRRDTAATVQGSRQK